MDTESAGRRLMEALFEQISGLVLRDGAMLLLALLLVLPWLRRGRRQSAVEFAPAPLLGQGLRSTWRTRGAQLPRILATLGMFAIVIALARPAERVELPSESRGIDILLCLDASSSMAAKDMAPDKTRLELAKAAAQRFVTGRKNDAIGLVRFARFPDLVCPATRDHRAMSEFLDGFVRVKSDGPEDRTGIGSAIALASRALRSSTAKSRVIVLLTDGEENVATAATPDEIGPGVAAELCRELGIRVYAIAAGIGKLNAAKQWVELDTSQLELVAEKTGGAFFAAKDKSAIDEVYAKIDQLEKIVLDEPRYELRDRFQIFSLIGIACLVIAQVLAVTLCARLP